MRPAVVSAIVVLLLVDAAGSGAAPRTAANPAAPRRAEAERALRTGRYEEAIRLADQAQRRGDTRDDVRWTIIGGLAEQALGRLGPARARLEETAARAPGSLPVRAELMKLLDAVNDRTALDPLIDRTYRDWESGRVDKKNPRALVAVSVGVRLDNNYRDAKDTLDQARALAAPTDADADQPMEAELALGRLRLEKYEAGYAELSFRSVLKNDPQNPDARVGLARVLLEQGYDTAGAEKELAAALAENPRHAGARALRAEIALDGEDFSATAALLAQMRQTNPLDPDAAWLAAARALLLEDRAGFERERAARLATRPADAGFFARVAQALVRHRRYDDARAIAQEGTELDGRHAGCLAALGTTLLRLGDETAGLEALRRAFKRDPYDVRTYNLLNLFEKVIPSRYVTFDTAHFRFRVEPKTRRAVEAIVAPFLEQTYRGYAARYGYEPALPIVIELYGDPAHYAVRTVGLPGLGVAGVCFGRVITSQAPTNQAFNWGMVLAHELGHVFAIELSKSRVPRWFTEGLSEVETMRLRPEWERHNDMEVWAARKAGTLPALADLSNAFVSARNPDDATRAYMYAAVAMDFLERRFGFARIREALVAYGRGERGAPVLERLSGMKADQLEAALGGELDRRYARYDGQFLPTQTLKAPREQAEAAAAGRPHDAAALAKAGLAQLAAGDRKAAEAMLAKARAAHAKTAQGTRDLPSVMFLAGELALAAMTARVAADIFEQLAGAGSDGYDVRVRAALAHIHLQNLPVAEAHLRKAIAFDPSRVEPHALLSELLEKQGHHEQRLATLETALMLEPQNAQVAKQVVLGSARAGRPGRVVALAPIALFIDPADPDLHAAHGRALAATAKAADAAQAFERALLFAPRDEADIHRTLADLYAQLGEIKKAAEHRRQGSAAPSGSAGGPSKAKPWLPQAPTAPSASPPPRAPSN